MSSDHKPVPSSNIARSPTFWRAVILVIAGTVISATLWLFRPFQILAVPGMALTQVGALVVGIFQLRVRRNRPLGLGLLVGLVIMDLGTVALYYGLLAWLQISGALRNF